MSTSAEPPLIARPWIDDRIAAWRATDQPVLLIAGLPGCGKTVAMTGLSHSPDVLTAHFCRARDDRLTNPLRLVELIATRLGETCPGFRTRLREDPLMPEGVAIGDVHVSVGTAAPGSTVSGVSISLSGMSAREAFDRMVRRPWERLAAAERPPTRLVLVDALDEALSWPGRDTIVDLMASIASAPLAGLRFVLSTRPKPEVLERFGDLSPFDLDAYPDEARADVGRLVALSRPDGTAVVDAANGNLLVAYHMLRTPELRAGGAGTVALPRMYAEFVDRELRRDADRDRWRHHLRPVLALLGVARGPGLTVEEITLLADMDRRQARDALRDLGSFVRADGGRWHVFHESFRDFLAADDDIDAGPAQNLVVAERMLQLFPDWWAADMPYAVSTVAAHLIAAIDGDSAVRRRALGHLDRLVADGRWLVRRTSSDGVDALFDDLVLAGARSATALSITAVIRRQTAQLRQAVSDPTRLAQQLALGALSMGAADLRASARALAVELAEPFVDGVWVQGPALDALRLVTPAHAGNVGRVDIADDGGRMLSVGAADGTAVVWDASTGFALHTVTDVADAAAVWATDLLYTVGAGGGVRAWDLRTGQVHSELPEVPIKTVQTAVDGSRILLTSDVEAYVVEPRGWKIVARLPAGQMVATRDLQTVVSVQLDRLTALRHGRLRSVELDRGYVRFYGSSIDLSADGRVVAWSSVAESFRSDVKAFSVDDMRLLCHLEFQPPARVCLDADGRRVLVFLEDDHLSIHETETGATLSRRSVPFGYVHSQRVTPSGDVVAGSSTGDLYVLPVDHPGVDVTLPVKAGVTALRTSADGRHCVTGGPDGNIHLWDLAVPTLTTVTAAISSFVPVPGTSLIWTADTAGVLQLVDTADGSVRARHTMDGPAKLHACAPDGGALLVAVGDPENEDMVILDPVTGATRQRHPLGEIESAAWMDGGPLVAAHEGPHWRLYDENGRSWPTGDLPGLTDLRPVGEDWMLLFFADGTAALYDVATGTPVHSFPISSAVLNAHAWQHCAVSGDARLAVAHTSTGIAFLDLVRGRVLTADRDGAGHPPLALDRAGELLLMVTEGMLVLIRVETGEVEHEIRCGDGLAVVAVSDDYPQRAGVTSTSGDLLVCTLPETGARWSAWLDVALDRVWVGGRTVIGIADGGRLLCLRLES